MQERGAHAAVADLVPADVRGTAYGTLNAVYALARSAGGALAGRLYTLGPSAAAGLSLAVEPAAAAALVRLLPRPS